MATELLISGVLPSPLYHQTADLLTAFSERGDAFSLVETVFRRNASAPPQPGERLPPGDGGVTLRVKALTRRSSSAGTSWTVQVSHKPEPQRTSPQALQYSVSEFAVVEGGAHPHALASALGFGTHAFTLRQRGVRFERSGVIIDVYQLFESDDAAADPLDPSSYVVTASVRFSQPPPAAAGPGRAAAPGTPTPTTGPAANPPTVSSQEARETALAALEQVKRLLKGLVDLRRVE
ncbi:hypothetical protein JCM1840_006831 [Sporobolomyces johnsonii]